MSQVRIFSFFGFCGSVALFALVAINGCYQQTVYRTASGLTYRVWHHPPGGVAAGSGSTVKARFTERHGDSVYGDTTGRLPMYQALIPGLVFPYSPGEALGGAQAGDSIVIIRRVDELLAKGILRKLPSDWRPSDELVGTIVVERVFPFDPIHGDSVLQADKLHEAQRLLAAVKAAGQKRIAVWLRDHGIPAASPPGGVFRIVDREGTGARIDSGMTVDIRYRLMTLTGRQIKSNEDTTSHQPPVLQITIGSRLLPAPVDAALRGVNRGSRVRLFVPRGMGVDAPAVVRTGEVPPDDLVWELEVE
jgi:FKBP-type peptidyl-prolyl cis-trans isomerase